MFECKQAAHTHTHTHTHRPYKWPHKLASAGDASPWQPRPSLPPAHTHTKRGSGVLCLKAFVWLSVCVCVDVCVGVCVWAGQCVWRRRSEAVGSSGKFSVILLYPLVCDVKEARRAARMHGETWCLHAFIWEASGAFKCALVARRVLAVQRRVFSAVEWGEMQRFGFRCTKRVFPQASSVLSLDLQQRKRKEEEREFIKHSL